MKDKYILSKSSKSKWNVTLASNFDYLFFLRSKKYTFHSKRSTTQTKKEMSHMKKKSYKQIHISTCYFIHCIL